MFGHSSCILAKGLLGHVPFAKATRFMGIIQLVCAFNWFWKQKKKTISIFFAIAWLLL
jgi:hypothetical protein